MEVRNTSLRFVKKVWWIAAFNIRVVCGHASLLAVTNINLPGHCIHQLCIPRLLVATLPYLLPWNLWRNYSPSIEWWVISHHSNYSPLTFVEKLLTTRLLPSNLWRNCSPLMNWMLSWRLGTPNWGDLNGQGASKAAEGCVWRKWCYPPFTTTSIWSAPFLTLNSFNLYMMRPLPVPNSKPLQLQVGRKRSLGGTGHSACAVFFIFIYFSHSACTLPAQFIFLFSFSSFFTPPAQFLPTFCSTWHLTWIQTSRMTHLQHST